MVRVCFVCLGNICRSPTAEGIMEHLVREAGLDGRVEVDSAGTSSYHEGELADARSREVARGRGFELKSRARQFVPRDFSRFDYVIAMDQSNRRNLKRMAPDEAAASRIHLLRDFDATSPQPSDVPDPYFGGADGFNEVFDIVETACRGLLAHIRATLSI